MKESDSMGGKGNWRTVKVNQKQEKAEKKPNTTSESEDSERQDDKAEKMNGQDHNETLRVGLAAITKDIKDLKQEIRHELITLKDELKIKEIEHKLTDNMNKLQTQKVNMAEAQECIAEREEWKRNTGKVMMEMPEQTC